MKEPNVKKLVEIAKNIDEFVKKIDDELKGIHYDEMNQLEKTLFTIVKSYHIRNIDSVADVQRSFGEVQKLIETLKSKVEPEK